MTDKMFKMFVIKLLMLILARLNPDLAVENLREYDDLNKKIMDS